MIWLDVETTGVDEQGCSVIEIGALDFYNPSNRFYVQCQAIPGCLIDDFALNWNGTKKEELLDSRRPTQIKTIRSFDKWLEEVQEITVGGENPRFDLNFINAMYSRAGMKSPLGYRSVDLHTTAVNHFLRRGISISLKKGGKTYDLGGEKIMAYVGIPAEPRPHKGLNGAIWESEAYSRLVFGKNLLPEFEEYSVPGHLTEVDR